MHQKSPYEFLIADSYLPFWFTRLPSLGRKRGFRFRHGQDAAVGDGDPVRISAKIFDCIAKTIKSLLNIGTPVGFIQAVFKFLPFIWIAEPFTGGRKSKGIILIEGIQQRK